MHGLTVYVKDLLFAWDVSQENSADSYFQLDLLHSVSISAWFLMPYHLTLMRFSWSTHQIVFVFGDFDIHHKDWLTYSAIPINLIDAVNSVIIFLSQMTLLRWLTFPLGSQTITFRVFFFWISFFLLTLVFVLQWLSLHWTILIMLLSRFPLTFHQTQKEMSHSIIWFMTNLVLIGTVFVWSLDRCSMGGYLYTQCPAAVGEFCEWVKVGTDVYIFHLKYQVKLHSSPWFSAAWAADIVHRDHFFICNNRINLLNLK